MSGATVHNTTTAWTVRPATPDDAEYVNRQWDRYFGVADEAPVVTIGCDPSEPDWEYNRCYVAVTSDTRIGAAVASVGPLEHISHCIGMGTDLTGEFANEGNGYLHVGVVEKGWRNRGVGTALMRARLNWLAESGAEYAFGLSWLRDDHPDSSALFEKFGFEQLRQVDEYYRRHDARDYCPDCGQDCTCDAIVYRKDLPGAEFDSNSGGDE